MDKFIVFIAVALLYAKFWEQFKKNCKWITHLLAFLFSGFMLIGMSFSMQGSWSFFVGGRNQMIVAVITFAGFFILFDLVLSLIYSYGEKHCFVSAKEQKPFPAFVEKHYLLKT